MLERKVIEEEIPCVAFLQRGPGWLVRPKHICRQTEGGRGDVLQVPLGRRRESRVSGRLVLKFMFLAWRVARRGVGGSQTAICT